MSCYLTRKFLESIFVDGAGLYSLLLVGVSKSKRGVSYSVKMHGMSSRDISRTLWRLRRTKIVEFREDGEKVKIVLTELGKKRILRYKLEDMKIQKPKKWDGNWHIVAFDIP